jgi:CRP/FNR family transcriptional regulator, cyclic AMP receptor protein
MAYDPVSSPLYKFLHEGNNYRLPKGQVVHALDDRSQVNLIESGFIKRYRITGEGQKSIQLIYGPNDVFPMTPVYQAILDMQVYRGNETYYYESMTEIVVYSQPIEALKQKIAEDPSFYRDLWYAAGTKLNAYIARMEDISLKSSLWRTAYALGFLANQYGQKTEEGVVIPLPLTHQDLADLLDLSRETISRELGKLKERGLVTGNKTMVITDLDKLKSIYR